MLFDHILQEIGEFGCYQKQVYVLATIPAMMIAFETMSVIFIFFIPDHRCSIPGLHSDTYDIQGDNHSYLVSQTIPMTNGKLDQCHVYSNVSLGDVMPYDANVTGWVIAGNGSSPGNVSSRPVQRCDRWVYDWAMFDTTIATDFDIVCHRGIHRASSNMFSELGTLFGTFVIGLIADRFGRKMPFYFGGLALVGGGFGIAFTYDLISLNVCRFILGIARMAVFVNGIVIGMEIVGPSKRAWAGVLIEISWCLGGLVLVIFAYFIRNWRYLEIAVSIPSIVLLFYWWLIPESPRWLSSRGREAEAVKILERIAKSNKTKLPPIEDASQLMKGEEQISLRYAVRSKELLIRVIIVLSNMFVIVVVYYGLTLNITNLSGDVFINFSINTLLEMVAYFLCLAMLDRLGRKPVFTGGMVLSGAACALSIVPVLLGLPSWTVVVLSMVGRFAICIAFATIYVYGAELFPTVVRASAMGVGVTFARIGGIVSPFMADVGVLVGGKYQDALPLVIMGSPALVVGLLSTWLPETLHANLPDTLDDLKTSKMKRGCLCCVDKPDPAECEVKTEEVCTSQC
ncbi:organic cation transporter protein-like [Babylonia areolata]|uniref:organic cation transporter protein-like n=1 Tax=Babylonia areolata TaxID=304850 RepID=UPI003FCF3016